MYSYERISESSLHKLASIFKGSNGRTVGIGMLRQKFNTKEFGAEYIGYLAIHEEDLKPAAYYGVFPMVITFQGKEVLVAQSGDTITHPEHQGKGLFTKLANLTYDLAIKEGIRFIWGLPNKNSYPGFIKRLNWKDLGQLKRISLKVKTLPLAKVIKKLDINTLSSLYYSTCKFVFRHKEGYFSRKTSFDSVEVVKDEKFFTYKRYFNNKILYKNERTTIWFKVESYLIIGDFYSYNEVEFSQEMKRIKFKCLMLGISEVVLICNTNYFGYNFFTKLPNVVITENLPFCYLGGLGEELAERFSFSMADADTF